MPGIDYSSYDWTTEYPDHYFLERKWPEWQIRELRAVWRRPSSPGTACYIDYSSYDWTKEYPDHYFLERKWPEWQIRELRAVWPRSSSPLATGSRHAQQEPRSLASGEIQRNSQKSDSMQGNASNPPSMACQKDRNTPPMPPVICSGEALYGRPDNFPEESTLHTIDFFHNPMIDHLWQGAITNKNDRWVKMWDHVDFFRLVYITLALNGDLTSLSSSQEKMDLLFNIAAVFNLASLDNANRPPGFEEVLPARPFRISRIDIRNLFQLLGNKTNPNRHKPLHFVLDLAKEKDFSSFIPERVLSDIPEAISKHFQTSYTYNDAHQREMNNLSDEFLLSFQNKVEGYNYYLSGPPEAPSQSTTPYQYEAQSGPSGRQPYDEQQVAPQDGGITSHSKGKGKHSAHAPSNLSSSQSHLSRH